MPPPDISVRGIRGPIPSGYVLGRQSSGSGPPELISLSDLTNPLQNQVVSVFGRKGAVVATTGDYTVAQVTGAAPLASPVFTGDPKAPTATAGDNDTSIATTAFVQNALSLAAGGQPYLSAYLTNPQTLTPSTLTPVAYDTVEADTASGWNASTHVYTPSVAGRYHVIASVNVINSGNLSAGGIALLGSVQKNGANYRGSQELAYAGKTGIVGATHSTLICQVQMNGTTDNISVSVKSDDTSPSLTGASDPYVFLQIYRVGA